MVEKGMICSEGELPSEGKRSASVWLFNTLINSRLAWNKMLFNLHCMVIGQVLLRSSKHSSRSMCGSTRRITAAILISSGGMARIMPPDLPLVVVM